MSTAATGGFIVEVLGQEHDRGTFDCGHADLNAYLHTQARQDMDRGAAVVYVLVPERTSREIAGYYTLSSSSVRLSDWPDSVRKKLPRYPLVPVILIGRLAVSLSFKGHRLGERLLVDALERCHGASRAVGSVAVSVDAKDVDVATFDARYGFIAFPNQPLRMFLPMKTIGTLTQS
ncbi:MAG: GNAT family N-acetyltransferase [Longimicrobiales bacterium]